MYGIAGVLVAFLASNATVGPVLAWVVTSELLRMSNLHYAKEVLWIPLTAAFLAVTAIHFNYSISNIYFLTAVMAIFSSLYQLICYLLGAVPQQLTSAILEKMNGGKSRIRVELVDHPDTCLDYLDGGGTYGRGWARSKCYCR